MTTRERRTPVEFSDAGRWMRNAVIATFFAQGFLFASWTAHIPHMKDHLQLGDGSLGIAGLKG